MWTFIKIYLLVSGFWSFFTWGIRSKFNNWVFWSMLCTLASAVFLMIGFVVVDELTGYTCSCMAYFLTSAISGMVWAAILANKMFPEDRTSLAGCCVIGIVLLVASGFTVKNWMAESEKAEEVGRFYSGHPEIKAIARTRWIAEGQKGDEDTYYQEFYAKPENRVPPPPHSQVKLTFPRSLFAPGATRCVDGDLLAVDNYDIRFRLRRYSDETGRLRIYSASFDDYDSEHCIVLDTGYITNPDNPQVEFIIAQNLVSSYGLPEARVLPNSNR